MTPVDVENRGDSGPYALESTVYDSDDAACFAEDHSEVTTDQAIDDII